jgi:hypothetical protein
MTSVPAQIVCKNSSGRSERDSNTNNQTAHECYSSSGSSSSSSNRNHNHDINNNNDHDEDNNIIDRDAPIVGLEAATRHSVVVAHIRLVAMAGAVSSICSNSTCMKL